MTEPFAPSQTRMAGQLAALLRTMRPHQWVKNLLIFGGVVLSDDGLLLQSEPILRVTLAFIFFCLASSAVYILNDLQDIEKDASHPTKRERPLPSGRLSPTLAWGAMALFAVMALMGAFWLTPYFGLVVLLYILNNLLYNFGVKNLVILDVFSIAAGFVLRAVGGAVVVGVPISPWLYVLTALFSLFLGVSKRRHELLLLEDGRGTFRPVLQQYTAPMLEEMLSVVTASSLIAYSLYTFTAENMPANHVMMLTIPFVVYGIFRYLFLVHSGRDAPPDEMLFSDVPLLITIMLWGVSVLLILYGFGR
ncbi:MAG: decaprenyl-phosphate phosphoribosyltransferase [Anaerolineales bacterium]|nr:decaprenyl-phosphate phosphoribosyltransferase [Anaerolineales bacterium]MCB9127228.1 decaprenyl-phosphate phosphoribosyltransferase [Ardenticatenales bacterium]MCB9171984.1 decaprenyl-phosphate phosphoribosyltransferase [Ardenticatenales bacterium]